MACRPLVFRLLTMSLLFGYIVDVAAQNPILDIDGRVTDSVSHSGIESVQIVAISATGNTWSIATTGKNGFYASTLSLPPGNYRISTRLPDTLSYINQAFPAVSCFYPPCSEYEGSPYSIASSMTLSGIDFDLDRAGSLSVHVASDVDGTPIQNAIVSMENGQHGFSTTIGTDASGNTFLVPFIPVGSYKIYSTGAPGFVGEVFNDHACSETCDPSIGDDVTVSFGQTTQVEMGLRAGIGISGRISDASGNPVASSLYVYGVQGMVSFGQTGADGRYVTSGELSPGEYVIFALDPDIVAAVNPGIDCMYCDPFSTGTHVLVGDSSVAGVDLTVRRGAGFRGAVEFSDGTSTTPCSFSVFTMDGTKVQNVWVGGCAGGYRVSGLAPGYYFVATQVFSDGYVNELYEGIPCYSYIECDLSRATPIHVEVDVDTDGINFLIKPDLIFNGTFD